VVAREETRAFGAFAVLFLDLFERREDVPARDGQERVDFGRVELVSTVVKKDSNASDAAYATSTLASSRSIHAAWSHLESSPGSKSTPLRRSAANPA